MTVVNGLMNSLMEMCSSRNHPYMYPPHGRSLEIPREAGVIKGKFLEEMYENTLEFPGGGRGCKTKKPSVGEVGIFLKLHSQFISFFVSIMNNAKFKLKVDPIFKF